MQFETFKANFKQQLDYFSNQVLEFSWENEASYEQWLVDTYHYVCNSTRILALAAGCMPPEHTFVSNRFIAHAAEETNHEKLLEMDVKGLGKNINDLEASEPMKLYFQSLYYYVSPAGNPLGLIGWVLSLEGLATSIGPNVFERIEGAYGKKATNFIRVHADEDPDHLDKAINMCRNFNEEELVVIEKSVDLYCKAYLDVLKHISTQNVLKKAS